MRQTHDKTRLGPRCVFCGRLFSGYVLEHLTRCYAAVGRLYHRNMWIRTKPVPV